MKFIIVTDYLRGNRKDRLCLVSSHNVECWTTAINTAKTFDSKKAAEEFCAHSHIALNNVKYNGRSWNTRIVPLAPSKTQIDKLFTKIVYDATEGDNPEETLEARQIAEQVYNQLKEREQTVLTLVMYGFSYDTIGEMFNYSKTRVEQIHKVAKIRYEMIYSRI